jgi:hypothetical protein
MMYATALLFAFAAVQWYRQGPSVLSGAALASSLIIMTGLKYTGLVQAGFLVAFLVVIRRLHRLAPIGIAAVALVPLLHWNPYVTNWKKHGHPLHPVPAYDWTGVTPVPHPILDGSVPPNLLPLDRFRKALVSYHSEVKAPPVSASLAFPLRFHWREFVEFRSTDVRTAGFGPWFALAFWVSFIAWAFSRRTREWTIAGALSLSIGVFCLANPECWWARYVPLAWLIPLPLLFVIPKRAYGVAAGLLVLNAGLIAAVVTYDTVAKGVRIHHILSRLQEETEHPIPLPKNLRLAMDQRVRERGLSSVGLTGPDTSCFEALFHGNKGAIDSCIATSRKQAQAN